MTSKADQIREMLNEGVSGREIAKALHTTEPYVSSIKTRMRRKEMGGKNGYHEDEHLSKRDGRDNRQNGGDNMGDRENIREDDFEERLSELERITARRRFAGREGAHELMGTKPRADKREDHKERDDAIRRLDKAGVDVEEIAEAYRMVEEEVEHILKTRPTGERESKGMRFKDDIKRKGKKTECDPDKWVTCPCPHCKEPLNKEYHFCPACGGKIVWEDDGEVKR